MLLRAERGVPERGVLERDPRGELERGVRRGELERFGPAMVSPARPHCQRRGHSDLEAERAHTKKSEPFHVVRGEERSPSCE